MEHLESKKIDVYMPPCRLKHREYRDAKPQLVSPESTIRERMKSKVLTESGQARYGLRKETVEPVFGQSIAWASGSFRCGDRRLARPNGARCAPRTIC